MSRADKYVQLKRTSVRGLVNWIEKQRDDMRRCHSDPAGNIADFEIRAELILIESFLKELRIAQKRLHAPSSTSG